MTNDKLERKVAALARGDKSAFDYIYDATYKAVYFHALYIVRLKQIAEDVVQDTYLKALTSLDYYRAGTNFTAWLCEIAKNTALNTLRRYKNEQLTDFQDDGYKYGTSETQLPFVFELARKNLSAEEYQIVMLCQVAGYKRREVAEMTGIPIGTVTWKNNEALKKLKKILKEGRYEY